MVAKTLKNYIQYFLHLVLYSLCAFLGTVFVLRVLLSSYVYLFILCLSVVNVCVFVVSHVYLLYLLCVFVVLIMCIFCTMCIAVLTLDAELLARSQYPEGPATGHLDTGFS
jgi:hypothetical protein